ncbi:MAG TPA: hypothetical protein VL943_12960, partial [Niabella sp.]|nr:hypothetical protein [Niabella sp.]
MKKRMSLKHISGFILATTAFVSCSKSFLERPPVDAITDANFYKNDEQVLAASGSLYNRVWFSYNDQAGFALGDVRGGTFQYPWGGNFRAHVLLSTTADNPHLLQTWNAFFAVIA